MTREDWTEFMEVARRPGAIVSVAPNVWQALHSYAAATGGDVVAGITIVVNEHLEPGEIVAVAAPRSPEGEE